jgi:hypothetical protein
MVSAIPSVAETKKRPIPNGSRRATDGVKREACRQAQWVVGR